MAAVNFASASLLSRSATIKPSVALSFVGIQSISGKKVPSVGTVSARAPVRVMGSSVSAEAFAGKTVHDFTVKVCEGSGSNVLVLLPRIRAVTGREYRFVTRQS